MKGIGKSGKDVEEKRRGFAKSTTRRAEYAEYVSNREWTSF